MKNEAILKYVREQVTLRFSEFPADLAEVPPTVEEIKAQETSIMACVEDILDTVVYEIVARRETHGVIY